MKSGINNFNSKGELNGYQEWYYWDNKLYYRGNWKNHERYGYSESHGIKETNFYIK